MLAEERFALILNLLAEKRTATVQELCEAPVSYYTSPSPRDGLLSRMPSSA